MMTLITSEQNEITFQYGNFSFLAYRDGRNIQIVAASHFTSHDSINLGTVDTFNQARVTAVTYAELGEYKRYGITDNWVRAYELDGYWIADVLSADGRDYSRIVDTKEEALAAIDELCLKAEQSLNALAA